MRQKNIPNLEKKTESDYSQDSGISTKDIHQFEGTFEIINEFGMHGRPIVQFIKAANKYEADVAVEKVGEAGRVSGRSIIGLITLGLAYGSKMRLYVSGNGDAKRCFDDLKCLITSGFGEAYA